MIPLIKIIGLAAKMFMKPLASNFSKLIKKR